MTRSGLQGVDGTRRGIVLAAAAGCCAWAGSWSWPLRSVTATGRVAASRPRIEAVPVAPAEPVAPPAASRPPWEPAFVPRRRWTDRSPASNHLPMGRVRRLTVHHTGADTRSLGLSDLQAVQRIETYHRDERGWACIGYHFLIGDDGVIYQGRPLAMQGAHVRDANEGNIGISCIGVFDQELPSPAQLRSLSWLLGRLRRQVGLSARAVHGHRDLSPSTCPGDALYAWLQEHHFGRALG